MRPWYRESFIKPRFYKKYLIVITKMLLQYGSGGEELRKKHYAKQLINDLPL